MRQLQIVSENEFVKNCILRYVWHMVRTVTSLSVWKIPRHVHSPRQLVLCAHLQGIS